MQFVFVQECSRGLEETAGAIWGPNLLAATGSSHSWGTKCRCKAKEES